MFGSTTLFNWLTHGSKMWSQCPFSFVQPNLFTEQMFWVWQFTGTLKKCNSTEPPAWDTETSRLLGKGCSYQKAWMHVKLEMCCKHGPYSVRWHIYPISELGQVDYWTHLMLKTNTSYFTGSSQLNKIFFFILIFVTPSEIYIHMAAYKQIYLFFCTFWDSFSDTISTDCMH